MFGVGIPRFRVIGGDIPVAHIIGQNQDYVWESELSGRWPGVLKMAPTTGRAQQHQRQQVQAQ